MAKIKVTPAMAEKWLENNGHNRNVNNNNVTSIARMMKEGKWAYNGEPVIIGKTGILLDGQHRLMAVIKSKAEVWMEIVENVPEICEYTGEKVFATIDTGKTRNARDVISISDKSVNAGSIVKAIKTMTSVDTKVLKSGGKNATPTNQYVLDMFVKRKDELGELIETSNALKSNNIYEYMKDTDFMMIQYALRKEEDRVKVEKFIGVVSSFYPDAAEDEEFCDDQNLCRIVGQFYKKMSSAIDTFGGGNVITTLKSVGLLKAYHMYMKEITSGLTISKNMDVMYPDSLNNSVK